MGVRHHQEVWGSDKATGHTTRKADQSQTNTLAKEKPHKIQLELNDALVRLKTEPNFQSINFDIKL